MLEFSPDKKIEAIASRKVQGVVFRIHTQAKARELAVKPYVCNPAMKVEIVVVGENSAVETLV